MGYLIAFAIEYIGLHAVACTGLYYLLFLSGSCWLFVAMANDIKCNLYTITDVTITKQKLYNELAKFIEFHACVIQLSRKNNLWCVDCLACYSILLLLLLLFIYLLQACACIHICVSVHVYCDPDMDCRISLFLTFVNAIRISLVNLHQFHFGFAFNNSFLCYFSLNQLQMVSLWLILLYK